MGRRMPLIAGYNMIPGTHDLMKLSSCFMKYSGTFLCQMAITHANIPNGERIPNYRACFSRDLKLSLARTPFFSSDATNIKRWLKQNHTLLSPVDFTVLRALKKPKY